MNYEDSTEGPSNHAGPADNPMVTFEGKWFLTYLSTSLALLISYSSRDKCYLTTKCIHIPYERMPFLAAATSAFLR